METFSVESRKSFLSGDENGSDPTDYLYKTICSLADGIPDSSRSSEILLDEICRTLNYWNKDFTNLEKDDQDLLSIRIATAPSMVQALMTFSDYLFSEPGSKHKCLWSLNQSFALLSSTTPIMQQMLVEKGLMIGALLELDGFRNCPSSEDITYLIQLALSILCNLLQVPANVAYFMNTVCDLIVQNFTNSTFPKIRILSTSILCYLKEKVDECYLELSEKDVKIIIDMVLSSLSDPTAFLRSITLIKTMHVIVKSSELNAQKFISQGLLSAISQILSFDDFNVQEEILLLLWTLASHPNLVNNIKHEDSLIKSAESFKVSGIHNLATASMCALWDIEEQEKDYAACLEFAYGCYQWRMYERCALACEKTMHILPSNHDDQEICLLRGKSLFHLCNSGIVKLPKIISPKDIKIRRTLNSCIEYATEAVNLLGSCYDCDSIDEEGRKCLDLSMMFLISSANVLNKCQRCLLCLSNLKSRNQAQDEEKKVSGNASKQYKYLQHSHVVPKGILEAFSSGLIKTSSRRVFQFCGTETTLSQLKSPRETTWFMLCSKCEQIIGANEEEFINNFFKKIYDVSNPTMPLEAQKIDFGCWLYQFCVSMFFRGIATLDIPCNDYIKRFQNSERLYEIFVSCRQILLATTGSECSPGSPSVHILINSPSPTSEEKKMYTTIHEVLASPSMLGVAAGKNLNKYFVGPFKANLFLAHMGVINIVIDAEGVMPSSSHLINPKGGLFDVPHDSQRNQFIPLDVKEIFYISAQQMEIQKETISDKLRKSHWAKGIIGSPLKDREQTFLLHSAKKKDAEIFHQEGVMPAQNPSKPKIVSFLPQEFEIIHNSGVVQVPLGHRILFHCEPMKSLYQGMDSSFNSGITIFLAIGNDSKKFPANQPYAIYHKYDPGIQFNMMVFVSTKDLSVTGLIVNDSPQQTAERLYNNSHFQENIQRTLQMALYRMGFENFDSFLPHSQEKRVHSKCLTKQRCWYCIHRCDNCMNAAAIGLTQRISGVIVQFCSKICSSEFSSNPNVLNLLPAVFSIKNDNGKIKVVPPPGHTMLQRVTDHFDEDQELLASSHTTRICVGDGSVNFPKEKVYILYEISTVLRQSFFAFFITDDLSIAPLAVSPEKCGINVAMWFANSIQRQVCSVLEAVVSQAGFSSFKAWRIAAVQGKQSYFASLPYYEQY